MTRRRSLGIPACAIFSLFWFENFWKVPECLDKIPFRVPLVNQFLVGTILERFHVFGVETFFSGTAIQRKRSLVTTWNTVLWAQRNTHMFKDLVSSLWVGLVLCRS